MDVCGAIERAEKCALAIAEARVRDVSFGQDSDDSLYQLLAIEGYINSLDNYKKTLNLNCEKDATPCLTDDEARQIIEKINALCAECGC